MPPKKTSATLSAEDLTQGILASFDSEFQSASDRSFAVLAAAYMDSILEQLLRKAFVSDSQATELLLGTTGPIGSNGARYNLAYSLGLIAGPERDDLKTIARIRNHFAHSYTATTFAADSHVRDLVQQMHFAKRREAIRQELVSNERIPDTPAKADARTIFRDSIIEFMVTLLPRVRDVRQANPSVWYAKQAGVDA